MTREGERKPIPCPICGAPTVLLQQEVATSRGVMIVRAIVCVKCKAAGREQWYWEVGWANKHLMDK